MSDLMNVPAANDLTMSSREIAELVESRHDSVKRTMETLQAKGLIAFTQSVEKGAGRPATIYHVNKRDSYVVVAQLSPEFTARLVDRWQELEAQQTYNLPNFNDPVEAARAWADAKEGEIKALAYVERQSKYIGALENQLAEGITPASFAKELNGVNVQKVQAFLQTKGWMTKEQGGWVALHYARDKYLSVKWKDDQNGKARPSCYLTESGAKAIYRMYCKGELPMKKTWDGNFTPKHCLPFLDKEQSAA